MDGFYHALLGRAADPAGRGLFTSLLATGASHEQIRAAILASDEYFQRAGGTERGFLEALYHDVLGRGIDVTGAANWRYALGSGTTRQELAGDVLASPEALRHG